MIINKEEQRTMWFNFHSRFTSLMDFIFCWYMLLKRSFFIYWECKELLNWFHMQADDYYFFTRFTWYLTAIEEGFSLRASTLKWCLKKAFSPWEHFYMRTFCYKWCTNLERYNSKLIFLVHDYLNSSIHNVGK